MSQLFAKSDKTETVYNETSNFALVVTGMYFSNFNGLCNWLFSWLFEDCKLGELVMLFKEIIQKIKKEEQRCHTMSLVINSHNKAFPISTLIIYLC